MLIILSKGIVIASYNTFPLNFDVWCLEGASNVRPKLRFLVSVKVSAKCTRHVVVGQSLLSFRRHFKANLMIRLCSHRSFKSTNRWSGHHTGSENSVVVSVLTNSPLPAPMDLMIPRGIIHDPMVDTPLLPDCTPPHAVYVRAILISATLLTLWCFLNYLLAVAHGLIKETTLLRVLLLLYWWWFLKWCVAYYTLKTCG